MRTTIQLDDDVVDLVRRLAHSRRVSLGQTVSDLVRKGLVTMEDVKRLENESR